MTTATRIPSDHPSRPAGRRRARRPRARVAEHRPRTGPDRGPARGRPHDRRRRRRDQPQHHVRHRRARDRERRGDPHAGAPAAAVWTRVGGDVMDLALLGRALGNDATSGIAWRPPRRRSSASPSSTSSPARSWLAQSGSPAGGAPSARDPGPESRHHRPPAGRGLPLLARLREPAAVHGSTSSRCGCSTPGARTGWPRAGRRERRVGRRDHRGPAERAHRLALAGRRQTSPTPGPCASPRHPRGRHRGPGRAAIPAARRPARPPSRQAVRRGARAAGRAATCAASSR